MNVAFFGDTVFADLKLRLGYPNVMPGTLRRREGFGHMEIHVPAVPAPSPKHKGKDMAAS